MASILAQLQEEIRDRLLSDPFFSATRELEGGNFATIPVYIQDETETEAGIEELLGNSSVGVLVATLTADVTNNELPGPYFGEIKIVVRIGEVVISNRGTRSNPSATGTLKSAQEIAEKIHSILHHWVPASLSAPLLSDKPSIVNSSDEERNGRDCWFVTQAGLTYVLPQVGNVTLTDLGGHEFSATCETPGAAIFYTTNGRHPTPRSGTFYTGQVNLGAAGTVKARAWLAGYSNSPLATLNVS